MDKFSIELKYIEKASSGNSRTKNNAILKLRIKYMRVTAEEKNQKSVLSIWKVVSRKCLDGSTLKKIKGKIKKGKTQME